MHDTRPEKSKADEGEKNLNKFWWLPQNLRWLLGLRQLRSSEKFEILQIGLILRVA